MSETLALAPIWYAVFLFSVTLHEAAHAWAALRLGDPTAYHGGQVSLNPLPHVQREPFGMVLVPLISLALIGWPLGWASAPYDPLWADRYPRRAAWMALAGPASNLLLVVAAGILVHAGLALGVFAPPEVIRGLDEAVAATSPGLPAALATFLSVAFSLNLILCTFNLLPLPPLDGSGALPLVIGDEPARRYLAFMRQPMMGLLGLIVAWNLFGPVFRPIHLLALNLLYPGAGYH
ncbi:MAG: site-2 protease family protein [Acidobacteria bacterium]|nr:MAG: site-2 protease family protein [Acidobacteriota bacterium]